MEQSIVAILFSLIRMTIGPDKFKYFTLFWCFIYSTTVLGQIPPEKLGKTLTHEHIRMDYNCCFRTPSMKSHKEKVHLPMEIQNLGYIRQYP